MNLGPGLHQAVLFISLRNTMIDDDWYICILALYWLFKCEWKISILAVHTIRCTNRLFWASKLLEFHSISPVYVVRVRKPYVNSLFEPWGLPLWVAFNKLNLVPEPIVSGPISMPKS